MNIKELKEDLHHRLERLMSEVEARSPLAESVEWYLINQVRTFSGSLDAAKSKQDIENCTGVFSRFCAESMDWDTDLYKKCTEITALGFKLAKA
jgi:hypothetical protein